MRRFGFRRIFARALRANAQLARLRILDDLFRCFRIAYRLAILEPPGLRDFLLTVRTWLVLNNLANFEVRVVFDQRFVRNYFRVLIRQRRLSLGRANLDDVLDRIADLLGGILLGDLSVFNTHRHGVLDLTLLAFLDNLGFTRFQFRVDSHLDFERSIFRPLNRGGGRLALGADLDDLLDRLGHTLGFGLGVHNLRVLDGLGSGDLVLTELSFLNSFLLSGFKRVIEDDLGLERHVLFVLSRVSAFSLGANTDDLLDRFLGALSRHGRVTGRLAVHDLLSRGHNLGAKFTLLINLLLTFFQGVVEDNLSLERNRLLGLGHHRGVLSCRAVLNDLVDWRLGLLFLRRDLRLVALGSEVSGIGLLARHALLDDPDLTRLQLRIRAGNDLERNLRSPGDLLGRLGWLGADLDDLIHRLLGDFLGDLRIARLGIGDIARDRHLLLTRNTLGHNLRRTGRHARIELDLHTERNLRRNGLSRSTGGLGANTDDLLGWFLGAFRSYNRVARRLAVHELLSRSHNLGTNFTLLINLLLACLEGVVEDDLGLERNRLLGRGHQLAGSQARTILDDPRHRLLGGLFLSDLSLRALGRELSGVGLLAVLTFLNNPGFARLQIRVLANLGRVGDRDLPGHVLGGLGGLGADEDDLVDRGLGLFPAAVLVLLLRARLALGFNLVGASGDGVVVLVLDVERDLTGWDVNNVHHGVSGIRGAVLVGHGDRNLDLVTWLRIRRCGCGDLTIVVNGCLPTRREVTQLVRAVLGDVDVVRLVELKRQRGRLARVHRLYRVGGLRFPLVAQLHHGGDRHQRRGAVRSRHSDVDGLLVTWLGICRRGGRYDTGVRVNLVLPAVNFLLSDRLAVLILTERVLRTLRCVLDVVLHGLVRACGLHVVHRSEVTLQDDDGALDLLRLVSIVVVREDRDVQDVPLRSGLRNLRGDIASVLVDLDGPRATVIGNRHLGLAVLEGIALRGLVGRVTAQAAFWQLRLESDVGSRLTGDRVVGRDLDINNRLELGLDLIRGLVRIGRLHLRSDDGARCHSVIRLRGNLAGLIDGHGPASRNSGLVDLEFGRVDRLIALHDGLGAHLGGEIVTDEALSQARAHEVGDLGVVRVNNDEQFKLVCGAVGVFHCHDRARESARTGILRSGDGDVVVLVHLDGPALVDVLLVKGDLSFEAALALLLRQILDQVWGLSEGDLLWLGSQRAGCAVHTRDDRSVRLVVLRGVVLGIVQGERLGVDDVRRVVARQRVGAVEGFAYAEGVILRGSLELVHGTWLRQNGEVHVLVGRQLGTAVLRPGEEDVAGVFVDTQLLRTTRRCRVGGTDELAVAVVGLHDHAVHRVVRAAVLHFGNVDRADLGFFTRHDHVLFERLPRHRDRITFDVLARPWVHDSVELGIGTLRRFQVAKIVRCVVPLPGVAHRIVSTSLRGPCYSRIGETRVKINVPLDTRCCDCDAFVALVGNVLAKEGLTGFHGGHQFGGQEGAAIQDGAQVARIAKAPIGERAVFRVIEGEAQAPQGLVGARCTRFQRLPCETCLTAARGIAVDSTRTGRQV